MVTLLTLVVFRKITIISVDLSVTCLELLPRRFLHCGDRHDNETSFSHFSAVPGNRH